MEMKNFVLIIAFALVFGLSSTAYTVCWQDDFGALWKLKLPDYTLNPLTKISLATGFRQTSFTCNGTHLQPTTGSFIRNSDGNYVLGVITTATEACQDVSWQVVLDKTTLNGSGNWTNKSGSTGAFTLTKIPCSTIPSVQSPAIPLDQSDGEVLDPSLSK
jgi:hypothetical protein